MANSITIGSITDSNPSLFVKMSTLDQDPVEYLIQTPTPSSAWTYVNQFCSLLTTYWLNDPNLPNVYGISNLNDQVKIASAQALINLGSLDQQVTEATNSIANSSSVSAAEFAQNVATYPVGTKIWAGNNAHVVGFVLTAVANAATGTRGTYTFYDSNIGSAVAAQPTTGLAAIATALTLSAFVVGKPA
jgi:hypothetical protein